MTFDRKLLLFFIAILYYTIVAYNSIGVHHADEQFQIIEYARLLSGDTDASKLPWELEAQIRPSLQPYICYVIFQTCSLVNITNPFHQTFVLRLLTGLFGLFVIYRLAIAKHFDSFLYLALMIFLWFVPYVNVRFSSESLAGLTFALAISLVLKDSISRWQYFIMGTLLGLSFIFRYPMAFAILGLGIWMVLVKRESWYNLGLAGVGALSILVLSILLDRQFYGHWTFTPWNYFNINILNHKAATFGVTPWFAYIVWTTTYSILPIGILILFSVVYLAVADYKNLLVWVFLPFVIGHMLIGHKEVRFMFPLVNLIPLLLISTYQLIKRRNSRRYLKTIGVAFSVLVLIPFNILGLYAISTLPAGIGDAAVLKQIETLNTRKSLVLHTIRYAKVDHQISSDYYFSDNFSHKHVRVADPVNLEKSNDSVRNVHLIRKYPADQLYMKKLLAKKEFHQMPINFKLPFQKYATLMGFRPRNKYILLHD